MESSKISSNRSTRSGYGEDEDDRMDGGGASADNREVGEPVKTPPAANPPEVNLPAEYDSNARRSPKDLSKKEEVILSFTRLNYL